MASLIDSSIFITLERRRLPFQALLNVIPDQPVALASITASELLVGVHRADSLERRVRRQAFVEGLLAVIPIFPFDLRAARLHAELLAQLTSEGRRIGAHDLLIAATALVQGYEVLTHNLREFQRIPGLVVQQPRL